MVGNVVQAILVTPPFDVRAKHDGFNVIYRLIDLEIPFIYSSLMTNYKMLRERPEIVQRMVAALAEAVYFVEKNPEKAKAAIAKAMRVKDEEALQSSYNVYAKEIVDRTMVVPGKSVREAVEIARETGTVVRRKPEELYDNSFVNNLEKSGFLKELWGNENYRRLRSKLCQSCCPTACLPLVRRRHSPTPICPNRASGRFRCAFPPAPFPADSCISTPPSTTVCSTSTASSWRISLSAAAPRT